MAGLSDIFSVLGSSDDDGALDEESVNIKPSLGVTLDRGTQAIRLAHRGPLASEAAQSYGQASDMLGALTEQLAGQRDASISRLDDIYKRAAPSDSEKWLSIAAALFAPTKTGKTSESLSNALSVFGKYQGERRKFDTERAIGIADLMDKYDLKSADLRGRFAVSQAQAGGKPRISLSPTTGLPMALPAPGEVAYPNTKEEYDALPVGTWFMISGGKNAGTVTRKVAG